MNEKRVLDKGFVRLVDSMGDDSRVVQAARVSYGEGTKTKRQDEALIDYLMRHRHTSPFEKVVFEFHVKAPIFVARQWMRHRTGSFNEVSARYSQMPEEFYEPRGWRLQAKDNKQGSEGRLDEPLNVLATVDYRGAVKAAWKAYSALLAKGVSREMARMVLPVSLYTEFYWTVNLHNLLHFLELRLDRHAQEEIRAYAQAILELIEPVVPVSVASWRKHRLEAVAFSADEMRVLRYELVSYDEGDDGERVEQAMRDQGMSESRQREFFAKLGLQG